MKRNDVVERATELVGGFSMPSKMPCLSWSISAMIVAIRGTESSGYFRWHDSGDLQDVAHLAKLVEIARALPDIKFWLPIREYGIIASFLRTDSIPENLIVRLSAYMIEGEPPALAKRLGLTTSGVSKTGFTLSLIHI
jgi:hypothetical protein